MLSNTSITEIKNAVGKLLSQEHTHPEKKILHETRKGLVFACPRCGDSEQNPRKKRGNIFFDSGFYHCYNCGWHTPLMKFFALFDYEIDDLNTRVDMRKTVSEYIESGIAKSIETVSQEKIDSLKQYAIRKDELMAKLQLQPVFGTHEYVSKKHLFHRINHMAYKRGNIYFFNMLDDEYLLGFQIRTFNPKFVSQMKYIKYPINKIYDKFFPEKKPKDPEFQSLDKISLLYNLLTVDFNRPVTVFEGASDSWLYPNSIGKSSVGTGDEFLDEINNVRYFFDNDPAGYKKMAEKIKNGKKVFMWRKFMDDMGLWEYESRLKDWADIIVLSKEINRPLFKHAEEYFSNESLDLIYV